MEFGRAMQYQRSDHCLGIGFWMSVWAQYGYIDDLKWCKTGHCFNGSKPPTRVGGRHPSSTNLCGLSVAFWIHLLWSWFNAQWTYILKFVLRNSRPNLRQIIWKMIRCPYLSLLLWHVWLNLWWTEPFLYLICKVLYIKRNLNWNTAFNVTHHPRISMFLTLKNPFSIWVSC